MLNLISPINDQLGYGICGLNITHELYKKGIGFSLSPIGEYKKYGKYSEAIDKGLNTQYNENWPTYKIYHQFDMSMPPTIKRCGVPIFELDNFNEQEKLALNSLDQICVCSSWAKSIIEKHIPNIPTKVVPLGIDNEIFYYRPRKRKLNNKIRFINVGKWEVRKGHKLLPILLNGLNIDFELWMMPDNPFLTKEEDFEWKNYYRSILGNKVKFVPRMSTQLEVAEIMAQCDIGVFLSFAEGFNLDLVEVMAVTGNPAYATNYSAHKDILTKLELNDDTQYDLEAAYDSKWFFGQGNWAEINLGVETKRLQNLVDDYLWNLEYEGCHSNYQKDFSELVQNSFSWSNTVDKLLEVL